MGICSKIDGFKNWIRDVLKKDNVRAFIVATILLISAVGIHLSAYFFINGISEDILGHLDSINTIQNSVLETSLSTPMLDMGILKNQYLVCDRIKNYYMEIATTYYKHYYAMSFCSIIFTTLLTIAVFLVAHIGWQNSKNILKTFLLSTAVIASIYYFLPNVLNNKNNYENNIMKVKVYQDIQSEILSFSNRINNADEMLVDSVITSNYSRISKNLDYLSTIDNSKLNDEIINLMNTSGIKQQSK